MTKPAHVSCPLQILMATSNSSSGMWQDLWLPKHQAAVLLLAFATAVPSACGILPHPPHPPTPTLPIHPPQPSPASFPPVQRYPVQRSSASRESLGHAASCEVLNQSIVGD